MAKIGYGYGSEWHLLQQLGRRREKFTELVAGVTGCRDIQWLDHEEYTDHEAGRLKLRERRGLDFLAASSPVRMEWERRWPQGGNVHNWDALGRSSSAGAPTWILTEAKAHLGEIASSCSAKSPESIARIRQVLNDTKADLGAPPGADWMSGYYQYCNRVALLHFLRQRQVDARILFVYFTGDRGTAGAGGRNCPPDESAWRPSLDLQERHAGIPATASINSYIHKLFIPAYHFEREPARRLQPVVADAASGAEGDTSASLDEVPR